MKPAPLFFGLTFALVLAPLSAVADISDFMRDLGGKDEPKQAAAFERAAQYGPEAVPAISKLLDSADPAAIRAAKMALEKIAGAATREECARLKLSRALCESVAAMRHREGRDWLLWILSYAGGPEAVHTLVCLLPNPDAFDMTVFALQSIGGAEAARALVCQLACADDAHKVALLTALGVIGSTKAEARPTPPCCCGAEPTKPVCVTSIVVPALLKEAQQYNAVTATAAIDALGRIGAADATGLLWRRIQAHPDDVPALNAYLKIAEKQAPRAATAMYLNVLRISADHNAVCAALHGLGTSGGAHVVKPIVQRLGADRTDIHGAAVDALTRLHGPDVDQALRRAAAKAAPEVKAALTDILEARKQAPAKDAA